MTRTGALEKRVFKEVGEYGTLRELGRTHTMVVQDVVRVQNQIKGLLRSRGVAPTGKNVYSEKGREELLAGLPDASRGAAKTLYAQYDAVEAIGRIRGPVAERALLGRESFVARERRPASAHQGDHRGARVAGVPLSSPFA